MSADPVCIARAIANGFPVVEVRGELLAVRRAGPECYAWKLEPGSEVHACLPAGVRGERAWCDCEQFRRASSCKHLEALRKAGLCHRPGGTRSERR